jgi:hypothetical protein
MQQQGSSSSSNFGPPPGFEGVTLGPPPGLTAPTKKKQQIGEKAKGR